jgi:UDP:flavonoid glycosyltransferase YjiC (YdhE family)
MRILFTFVGGHGHFEPLAPLAHAAATAGHTVAFGCAPAMLATVQAAGFACFALGASTRGRPARAPLRAVDLAREERDLRERFVRRAARERAPLTIALCSQWRPDLLVCDETDFGAIVAAERLSLPHATVLVIAAGSFVKPEVVGQALHELRDEHGLPRDPELEMLRRYLVLAPFPRSYRDPADPLPATAHTFRPATPATAGDPPAWAPVLSGAPTVYVTLGTIFNLECGDLFARILTGLRGLPIQVVVTVGHSIDPAELGPQPSTIHVARYIPQSEVLPHCDLVVCHGGSGSVMGALTHGLPSVLIPMGADQPQNAARCAQLGVAKVLDVIGATPETVRAAVAEVLHETAYRRSAERLRDDIAALPPIADAVDLLERLAAQRQALYAE